MKIALLPAISATAAVTASPGHALNLLTNLDPTPQSVGGFPIDPTALQAVGFDLLPGSDYVLEGIDLRLSLFLTAADVALLQIYEDTARTSTNPNGATLQSLTFTNPPSPSNADATFTFTPNSLFTFRANTRYWLLLRATAGDFFWLEDVKPYSSAVGVNVIGTAQSFNNGATYDLLPGFRPGLRIRAVPFAFDGGLGLVGLGGLGWLSVRRKKAAKASDPRDVG